MSPATTTPAVPTAPTTAARSVRVVARTQDGQRYSYTLQAPSTWDAFDAVLERFGPELARCSVRPTTTPEAANV
jgi:hypothetical protein